MQYRPAKSWDLPDGTVLAQTLTFAGRRIETRLLVKQQNDFAGYSYMWNAAQSDAELAEKGGAEITVADTRPWRIPARAECMMCHSRRANFSLTLHEWQLNRDEQIERWQRLGLLRVDPAAREQVRPGNQGAGRPGRAPSEQGPPTPSPLLPRAGEPFGRFVPADDPGSSLDARARSYLAVNCAHCHTFNGGGNSAIEFDWLVSADRMGAVGEPPQHGDFGLADARVIAPGAAGRSVILPRVAMRGAGQMPPVGSRVPDSEGVRLLAEWIASLKE